VCRQTAADQTADESAAHVAAADDRDFG